MNDTETDKPKTDAPAAAPVTPPAALVAAPEQAGDRDAAIPDIIRTKVEYDRAYAILRAKFHILTPMSSFSALAPQHGLVVTKVHIDSDPANGEVYSDKLFCKTGSHDPLDDEVALTKIALRRFAIAGGWNLKPEILKIEKNYWLVRASNTFVGIDGAKQVLEATEEYDLRDGSPQVQGMSAARLNAARSHGLRGAEARALNAALREFGIRQKFTRRDLQKPFILMRMMFLPDVNNQDQMRMVAERAMAGVHAFFPHAQATSQPSTDPVLQQLEPVNGLDDENAKVVHGEVIDHGPQYVRIREITSVDITRNPPKTGTFKKWSIVDAHGEVHTTIKKDIATVAEACWNKDDWKQGREVEIESERNRYRENEIISFTPKPDTK